jgi:hypothetical protein
MRLADWDHEKFAANLCRRVAIRRHISSFSSASTLPNTRPFDQLLILGPTRHHSLNVLSAFPAVELFDTSVSDIARYCYPTGNYRDYLRAYSHQPISDQFSFKIANRTGHIYGVCVHACARRSGAFGYLPRTESSKVFFCLCILTSVPTFSEHFGFLARLVQRLCGKEENWVGEVEPPEEIPDGQPLLHLRVQNGFGVYSRMTLPKGFVADVFSCYSRYCAPPRGNPVLRASLDTLFSVFSIEDILAVLSVILLDGQVVVCGTSLQEITMTVYALTSVIRPIEFAGPVIPLIPNSPSCLQILQSPTPFVIGCVATDDLGECELDKGVVIMDTDKRKVTDAHGFPRFPNEETVAKQLQAALADAKEMGRMPDPVRKLLRHSVAFSTENVEEIARILRQPFAVMMSDELDGFFVTDLSAAEEGVTVFNGELFRAIIPPENAEFFQALMEAMTFQG